MADSTAKWFGANTAAGAYQAVVGVVMIGIITAVFGWLKGLQFHWAVLFGVAVTLGLALAANLVSLVIVRHRKKPDSPTSLLGDQIICPYEWVHTIADEQKREIRSWIHLEKWILEDADFVRAHPYLQFRFTVRNGSIYHVSLTELSGKIDYANVPITGIAKWVGGPIKLAPSARNDVVLRFIFDDPEDAIRIQNTGSSFVLHDLKVRIETEPETTPKDYAFGCSLDAETIRAKYPKMEMEILDANVDANYDFNVDDWNKDAAKGAFVSVYLRFKNPRARAIVVETFRLDTAPAVERLTPAMTGDIYQQIARLGEGLNQHKPLTPNLYNDTNIVAGQGVPFEGWLQFYLPGVKPENLQGATPTVIIVDKVGEEHRRGTSPLQFPPK